MTARDRGAIIAGAGLGQARRIESACEEFERRWRSGQRPRIESEVNSAQPGDQAALFEELLILELELHRAGEPESRRIHRAISGPASASRPSCSDHNGFRGTPLGRHRAGCS